MPSFPTSFKALKIVAPGHQVAVEDVPFPSHALEAGRVLVKVLSVGLNPTDWKHALGPWGPEPFRSVVTGCDAVGEVVQVGSAVAHLAVGDRIAGFLKGAESEINGAYADYAEFRQEVCFKLPQGMTPNEAAAFPIPHLTAVQALYGRLKLDLPSSPSSSKQTILIWGGSTAVGHHAVQLAHASGYRVFATASPANHASLKALGVDECFNYRDANVVEAIKAASNGGVDAALDTACEQGSTDLAIDCISSAGGRVVTILPFSDETAKRRSDVRAEFTLVYTMLGYALTFANVFDFPKMSEDAALAQSWCSNELPSLISDWKAGQGASKFKGQKLRELEGGFAGVEKGMKIMQAGDYRAEKLVASLE